MCVYMVFTPLIPLHSGRVARHQQEVCSYIDDVLMHTPLHSMHTLQWKVEWFRCCLCIPLTESQRPNGALAVNACLALAFADHLCQATPSILTLYATPRHDELERELHASGGYSSYARSPSFLKESCIRHLGPLSCMRSGTTPRIESHEHDKTGHNKYYTPSARSASSLFQTSVTSSGTAGFCNSCPHLPSASSSVTSLK